MNFRINKSGQTNEDEKDIERISQIIKNEGGINEDSETMMRLFTGSNSETTEVKDAQNIRIPVGHNPEPPPKQQINKLNLKPKGSNIEEISKDIVSLPTNNEQTSSDKSVVPERDPMLDIGNQNDFFSGLEIKEPQETVVIKDPVIPEIEGAGEVVSLDTKTKSLFKARSKADKTKKKVSKKQKDRGSKRKDIGEMTQEELIDLEYSKMKRKRLLTSAIILVVIGSLVAFGFYNTFMKPEKPAAEIASQVNSINRTTPFPEGGVENFIKSNIDELVANSIKKGSGTSSFSIPKTEIYVTKIDKKTAFIADIHFSAVIQTDVGENRHNFVLPLSYDYETTGYSPAGDITITPLKSDNNTKKSENPVLSFKGLSKANDETTKPVETFTENFLIMMYNEDVDISPYYKGSKTLGDSNAKFSNIKEFKYYNETNRAGYNTIVTYNVLLNQGVQYTITSYMKIDKSGDSYIITKIM